MRFLTTVLNVLKNFFNRPIKEPGDETFNPIEMLSKISTPTLIMHGEKDLTNPLEVGKYLNEQMTNSQFHVFKGRGHVPIYTATNEAIHIIHEFIQS